MTPIPTRPDPGRREDSTPGWFIGLFWVVIIALVVAGVALVAWHPDLGPTPSPAAVRPSAAPTVAQPSPVTSPKATPRGSAVLRSTKRYDVSFAPELAANAGVYLVITMECAQPPHGYSDIPMWCSHPVMEIVDAVTWKAVQPGDEWPPT